MQYLVLLVLATHISSRILSVWSLSASAVAAIRRSYSTASLGMVVGE